jgi:hypothetical protein
MQCLVPEGRDIVIAMVLLRKACLMMYDDGIVLCDAVSLLCDAVPVLCDAVRM